MTRALTYVEIDVPQWTQQSPDSPETEFTLRFAVATDYLPNSIAAIPSITDVSIRPATVSLGENLGQRAEVTITFRDHRHRFDGEDFSSGTFWGKFRARYGLTIQGNPFRLIRGTLGQDLESMETRHFILEGMDGPSTDGTYQITAKDVFTFATGDRAQAPVLSNGYAAFDFVVADTAISILPTGVGAEYPASGVLNIGGTELCLFTNAGGDVLNILRGQLFTTAIDHEAGERLQVCLAYDTTEPADIIYFLLVDYAGVPDSYIPYDDWLAETTAYLGEVYSTVVTEPKPVTQLLSEIIEQASLALWWDDIGQKIRLQVLRPVSSDTATFDQNSILAGTLEVREQPEKRISEVQVYYAKSNFLAPDDQDNIYRGNARTSDPTAVAEYGSASIKKILSRWISFNGRTTAEKLAAKQLGRYRDPPRAVTFDLMRDQYVDPQLGTGYLLGGTPFQDITGASNPIAIQVTRVTPLADHFEVEAEEMLWTPFGTDITPSERNVTLTNNKNVNLRDLHDLLYPVGTYLPIGSGDIVNCLVPSDVVILSQYTIAPAFDVGNWPAGVTINVIVSGLILGCAGQGGTGGNSSSGSGPTAGSTGEAGGAALYTRYAINLTSTGGHIWGGGGGGGGNGGVAYSGNYVGGNGGGGGAGASVTLVPDDGGSGGVAGSGETLDGEIGARGTWQTGGSPNGGAAGSAGSAGQPGGSTGGAGGAAGAAIDGDSFVTDIGAPGDILGTQIN